MSKTFSVIGGGPAGCTLAILLVRNGHKVVLFNDKKPSEIFVGESMIPALIPILRELGIEDKVKEFSVYKPGASVWVDEKTMAEASFGGGMGSLPSYAYNTNRKKFDELLLETAKNEGVYIISEKANLFNKNDKVFLTKESILAANGILTDQPDFIIDASGRKRIISNLLKLPTTKGQRMDAALFAHVEEMNFSKNYGDIHMHLATKGWCWRIPLLGKTSVGVVVNKEEMSKYGQTLEEQFDNYLQQAPKIRPFFKDVKRIGGIQKYSNYQLQSNRIVGENWVLIGDAAGFLDPVFSSGLYFSMKYASELAKVFNDENELTLNEFQNNWSEELNSWKKMIEIWYNGRLFTNFKMGNDRLDTFLGRRIGNHAIKHFTAIFTGEAVNDKYSMRLLRFMTGPLLDLMRFMRMHRYNVKDLEL